MTILLSKRLQQVASFVQQGARLLDVGSDHAYLPVALIVAGQIEAAVAGEVVAGPYQFAVETVSSAGLEDRIIVRLADGLAAMKPSDRIDTITICGMGGRLIADILDKGRAELSAVRRLVLQPNNREDDLRRWLTAHGYAIVAEDILEENGKRYEIIVAEAGQQELSELDIRFGPFLRQDQSPIFLQKWQQECAKLEEALAGIPIQYEETRSAISQKIQAIKEVLHES
ncbi:tRNA (adenine(22)-N(1))-methyltransferase TrmK [Streptococcus sp. E17BB]|uniref:tRNA (adenine(22)-N(1))-methyltransferase n=1 Tax=Streptococcus sp. E17BB TaxID=3278714 RepID=UPI00359CFCFC